MDYMLEIASQLTRIADALERTKPVENIMEQPVPVPAPPPPTPVPVPPPPTPVPDPPPPTPVPPADVVFGGVSPNARELDSAGLPWDEGIHAGTKTKTVSGAWKSKRGARDESIKQVTAELMASNAAPSVPGLPTPATPNGFAQLAVALSDRVTAGTLTKEQVDVACQAMGVASIPALMDRPDLVPAVAMALGITL